jgi:hypothetical protein
MRVAVALILFLGAGMVQVALAEEAHTTRIETRPYYGAVVTIENGVRVWRPVPPTTHMIINPDGLTPLAIGVNGAAVVQPSVPAAER